MRMNQLPMPASGASTARLGRRMPPNSHGSLIWGTGVILTPTGYSGAVALPDEPQARERQLVVDLVELVAEPSDRPSEAAGRDRGRLDSQLFADAAHHAVEPA